MLYILLSCVLTVSQNASSNNVQTQRNLSFLRGNMYLLVTGCYNLQENTSSMNMISARVA